MQVVSLKTESTLPAAISGYPINTLLDINTVWTPICTSRYVSFYSSQNPSIAMLSFQRRIRAPGTPDLTLQSIYDSL